MTIIDGPGPGSRPPRPTTVLAAKVEGAAALDAPAARLSELAGKAAGTGRRKDLLSGTWLGHPLHPLLVAVPIGFWSAASLLDLTRQERAARTLVGAGLVAAVPTGLAGASDWADTMGAERRVGLVHLAANSVATTAYAASWLARRRGRHAKGALLALVGAGASGLGGWLGGHLSYALGVGVDTNAFEAGLTDWTPLDADLPEAGPPSGAVVAGEAGGTAVAVAHTADGVHALADRCSHRGGPLSGGEVTGGCLTCPWHGSRFDARTGEVVQGPATVPQPTFELRRAAGRWQVRRDEARSLRTNPV
ncbi:MAG TPA: Rieske (2Fe-2S) protein [Acidimicrobiales bacterium]|nr:Rieske (2Fe-2S) protein [Acidimicrobiales bacterium]